MAAAGLARGVGEHRRARGHARSDARAAAAASRPPPRRSRHLRAAGMRHVVEHQHQPPQRAPTSRALYEHLARARDLAVAGPAHRAARPRRRSARCSCCSPRTCSTSFRASPRSSERACRDGILVMPGNNLGYFGPEEALLRSLAPDGRDHWRRLPGRALRPGHRVRRRGQRLPVAADRALRRRQHPADRPLADIWSDAPELAFARRRTVDDLWGFCRTCTFAATCLGGCSFTAHAVFGRPGNNPYCHYRARTLARSGRRERLVPRTAAPGYALRQRDVRL